jgi:hypothetical protein
MTWLRLSEATTLIHHDVQKARERLERAISKAWRVGPGALPQHASDPNVPLRIHVTTSPGLRIEGRDWLEKPRAQLGNVRNRMLLQTVDAHAANADTASNPIQSADRSLGGRPCSSMGQRKLSEWSWFAIWFANSRHSRG